MKSDDKSHSLPDNRKLPSLKESDYWAETNDNAAIFTGVYFDYRFKIRYSFKTRQWIGLDDDEPFTGYTELLKWELYLHEKWLPKKEPPTFA